jgi:hypothetical protein
MRCGLLRLGEGFGVSRGSRHAELELTLGTAFALTVSACLAQLGRAETLMPRNDEPPAHCVVVEPKSGEPQAGAGHTNLEVIVPCGKPPGPPPAEFYRDDNGDRNQTK